MSKAEYDNLHKAILLGTVNQTSNLDIHDQVDSVRQKQNFRRSMAKQQAKMDAHSRATIAHHAAMVSSVNTGIASNQYIEDILTREGARIKSSDRNVKNEQMKLRQRILERTYMREYYSTGIRCTIATMFMVLFFLSLTVLVSNGTITTGAFWMIVGFVALVYLIAMVLVSRRISLLRDNSDGIYRWQPNAEILGELRQATAKSPNACGGNRKHPTPSCHHIPKV
jgi:hypothetical protein